MASTSSAGRQARGATAAAVGDAAASVTLLIPTAISVPAALIGGWLLGSWITTVLPTLFVPTAVIVRTTLIWTVVMRGAAIELALLAPRTVAIEVTLAPTATVLGNATILAAGFIEVTLIVIHALAAARWEWVRTWAWMRNGTSAVTQIVYTRTAETAVAIPVAVPDIEVRYTSIG